MLHGAIQDADELAKTVPSEVAGQLEVIVQRGVAQAFKK